MASVNKVILIGNLGADPEVRYTPEGNEIANIRLATTDYSKPKNGGGRVENTEWHRVVFFGTLAGVVGQYLKKGSSVYVEGRIRTNKWQDKDGNERYTTEIIGSEMKMLGPKPSGDYAQARPATEYPGKTNSGPQTHKTSPYDEGDDIPF